MVAWTRLELDLAAFEMPELTLAPASAGLELTTLTDLGDCEETRYRMFELNRECSADIPGRGPFHTWEQYCEVRLDIPWFNPASVSLAIEGDTWVGMASFTAHPKPTVAAGYLFSEMTGVVRSWRRQGLATALKAHNLDLARRTGFSTIRTVQHPGNTAMIALNRKLGFVDATWPYPS